MAEIGIMRQATVDERKNFREIGRKTILDRFREKVNDKQQEYTELHRPFCARCAVMDFKDMVEAKMKELQRKQGYANIEDPVVDVKFDDLGIYGSLKRFELIKGVDSKGRSRRPVQAIHDYRVVDNMRTEYKRGYFVNFTCKVRGCGNSVEVNLKQYDVLRVEVKRDMGVDLPGGDDETIPKVADKPDKK